MKGSEFKAMRESLGFTQEELAEVLCLSGKKAVSNIETGRRNPSLLSLTLMLWMDSLSQKDLKTFTVQIKELSEFARRKKTRSK